MLSTLFFDDSPLLLSTYDILEGGRFNAPTIPPPVKILCTVSMARQSPYR